MDLCLLRKIPQRVFWWMPILRGKALKTCPSFKVRLCFLKISFKSLLRAYICNLMPCSWQQFFNSCKFIILLGRHHKEKSWLTVIPTVLNPRAIFSNVDMFAPSFFFQCFLIYTYLIYTFLIAHQTQLSLNTA